MVRDPPQDKNVNSKATFHTQRPSAFASDATPGSVRSPRSQKDFDQQYKEEFVSLMVDNVSF